MLSNYEKQKRFIKKNQINQELREKLTPEQAYIYRLEKNYTNEDLQRAVSALENNIKIEVSDVWAYAQIEKYFGIANILIFENKNALEALIIALIYLGVKYQLLRRAIWKFAIKNLALELAETKEIFNLLLTNNNLNFTSLEYLRDLINERLR